jgi:hypothetical protein
MNYQLIMYYLIINSFHFLTLINKLLFKIFYQNWLASLKDQYFYLSLFLTTLFLNSKLIYNLVNIL